MSTLQSTQSILTLWARTSGQLEYANDVDGEPVILVTLDRATYEDMGRPEVITVMIEPGDKLNNE